MSLEIYTSMMQQNPVFSCVIDIGMLSILQLSLQNGEQILGISWLRDLKIYSQILHDIFTFLKEEIIT